MSDTASLAGQAPTFPVVIDNPPGRSAIDYRVGDYAAFRDALLQSLPGEASLLGFRPAEGDLTLQLLEWWAYLADILTFYNERIANASYLGTAVLPAASQPASGAAGAPAPGASPGAGAADPGDAQKIARVLGFRPTPGIAATGVLGVLVNALRPITIPAGFAVQNKPGPGQQPQVFEAGPPAAPYLPTTAGGAVPIDLSTPTAIDDTPGKNSLLLPGTINSLKPGDMVAVAESPYASATSTAAVVSAIATENDPRGRANTRLTFASLPPPPSPTAAADDVTKFQVLRSIQSASVYAFAQPTQAASAVSTLVGVSSPAATVGVHLASLVRTITVGDLVVLEVPPTPNPDPASSLPAVYTPAVVTQYQETIWYANADAGAPTKPPAASLGNNPKVLAVPVPHTFLLLETTAAISPDTARVWYAYRSVGAPLDELVKGPILANAVETKTITPAGVVATSPGFAKQTQVLLEGADGIGAVATLTQDTTQGRIALTSSDAASLLVLPLRVLFNVMSVTAGKTVAGEVLGDGDSTVAGQSFTLKKSPLTYMAGNDPGFPTSTLQVRVDSVAWTEVASFSGQPSDAKVFVTQEDPSHVTTLTFGDGVHGARLPTGAGNVTATYRYGSGPGDPTLGGPAVGTLVTALTPQPGLGAVRNPVAMTGGAAPSTPNQVQASAPAAALTFGRAVSAGDFEAIASQAPRVTRTRAVHGWDPAARRALTVLYVGGGSEATAAAQHAIGQAADPNIPVVVRAATEIDLSLALVVVHDPSFDPAAVQAAVVSALTDPGAGPLSISRLRIGDALYTSSLHAACMGVPGVRAVRGLTLSDVRDPEHPLPLDASLNAPGAGGFFALAPGDVHPTLEAGDG